MEAEDLQRYLRRELGVSSNELRKIYITEIVGRLNMEERLGLSRLMGHSVEMQEFVYRRHGDNDGGEYYAQAVERLRSQL